MMLRCIRKMHITSSSAAAPDGDNDELDLLKE